MKNGLMKTFYKEIKFMKFLYRIKFFIENFLQVYFVYRVYTTYDEMFFMSSCKGFK